jgi:hypothetical protein
VSVQLEGPIATALWGGPDLPGSGDLLGYTLTVDDGSRKDATADATFMVLGEIAPGTHVLAIAAFNAAGTGPSAEYRFVVAAPSPSATSTRQSTPGTSASPKASPSPAKTRSTDKPTSKPTAVAPLPGPHLFFVALKPGACRRYSTGEISLAYSVRLRVYGKTARHNWLMRSRFTDGSYGSLGPDSTRAIPGGREYRFTLGESLPSRDEKVRVTAEYVIDTDAGLGRYTRLAYESGPAVLTARYCE